MMLLTVVILISKDNSGDFQGVGLLEAIWKVIEHVLDA